MNNKVIGEALALGTNCCPPVNVSTKDTCYGETITLSQSDCSSFENGGEMLELEMTKPQVLELLKLFNQIDL